MQGKFICSICKKDYNDLNSYVNCVTSCYEKKLKEEKEAENAKKLEETNAFISKVKAAEKYLMEVKTEFKEKYPEEYKLNFGEKHNCSNGTCKCSDTKPKSETVELSYESDGKSEPKITAKINGKDITDETLKSLLDDPETKFIAQMLGLI